MPTKNDIIYILLGIMVWYVMSVTVVAKRCEEHFGWGFHSMFPVPMCNVFENTAELEKLENLKPVPLWESHNF